MDYFVSIGECYSHEWQITALIKSFEKLNLTKKLHIALSTNKKFKNFNIKSPNIYFFPNIGEEKEYHKYNKWYCLFNLLKNNYIKTPITVLEPHVILLKDMSEIIEAKTGDIIYQEDTKFNYNEKYFYEEIFLNFDKEYLKKYWMNFGDTIIFKNLSLNFFSSILNKLEMLSFYLDDYKNLDKIALLSVILDNNKSILVNPLINIESNLYQNNLNYVLNYRHGFKDIFHKNFYKNNKDFYGKDLVQNISEIRYTRCLDFFYQVLNYDF